MFEYITDEIAQDMSALLKVKSEDQTGHRLLAITDALAKTRQQVQVHWQAASDAEARVALGTLQEGMAAAHTIVTHIMASA
ncbi:MULTISPECIES: serine kinase [Xanthomonas]|uniref:Serine kinase n=1 Tax=Xanthomonas cucurbitae TaxID=56453 RepID=A0A2S7DFB3_9XANT|nr:serine kinase [Xanthomonas cucurbitae]PPU72444.1 hypothetical protein XcuCFBP2542_17165 [Xanthomonas cucurbitae]QHG88385.1 serine kinase [Xanthomonas cucurbitae]WDM67241.1 serine kinase [Xanthomonas cucurbitae]WDM71119.1 serine kinase [Xanthomonas cucurbitae]WDM74952.1 serine kinase [Xanthomonas cucurbitae]